MPPLYGGSEIIPITDGLPLGDLPIEVQPFTEQVPPSWTYGTQTFTGTEAIEAAQAQLRLSELYQGGGGAGFDYDFDFGSTPDFLETLAQSYVDFYEGDTTTAALLTDPVGTVTGGTVGLVTDVIGTDVITGSISAAGGAVADILDPITEPLGETAGKLLVPVAILGGAYLLLK